MQNPGSPILRILFPISLTTLPSPPRNPLIALTTFSFTYAINKNRRNSKTLLKATDFLEISPSCCGTDCRGLEEKKAISRKVRRSLCWTQVLVRFFGDRIARKNSSSGRFLRETLKWKGLEWRTRLLAPTLCYTSCRVQALMMKGSMITANIRTTMIPTEINLLRVFQIRQLLLLDSGKSLQNCNVLSQKRGLSCGIKLSQITVFT